MSDENVTMSKKQLDELLKLERRKAVERYITNLNRCKEIDPYGEENWLEEIEPDVDKIIKEKQQYLKFSGYRTTSPMIPTASSVGGSGNYQLDDRTELYLRAQIGGWFQEYAGAHFLNE